MLRQKLLLDSSFLIALNYGNDSQHAQALLLQKQNLLDYSDNFITPLILSEVLTVLTTRTKSLQLSKKFYEMLIESKKIQISNVDFHKEVTHFYLHNNLSTIQKLSWVDCSLLVLLDKEGFNGLITLDKGFVKYKNDFNILGV